MLSERKDVLVGAIEAGGTKVICAVGRGPEDVRLPEHRISFPTGDDPARLLSEVITWLKSREAAVGRLGAIGIASFGPIDLDRSSPTYGRITSTPKPGWQNTDLLGRIRSEFPGLPIGFDTDVNGAGLGEHLHGAAVGLDDFIYITLGTGIGAGGMARGRLLHGLLHPEMGHMRIPRLPGDTFAGACPYHGDCWEGLCSGPALEKRTGLTARQVPPGHEAWVQLTKYVGFALSNLVCTLSPKRIIIGGGVSKGGQLGEAEFFKRVRTETQASLNGYVASPMLLTEAINGYIVPPKLGDDAGICGSIALGQLALQP